MKYVHSYLFTLSIHCSAIIDYNFPVPCHALSFLCCIQQDFGWWVIVANYVLMKIELIKIGHRFMCFAIKISCSYWECDNFTSIIASVHLIHTRHVIPGWQLNWRIWRENLLLIMSYRGSQKLLGTKIAFRYSNWPMLCKYCVTH